MMKRFSRWKVPIHIEQVDDIVVDAPDAMSAKRLVARMLAASPWCVDTTAEPEPLRSFAEMREDLIELYRLEELGEED